jgi:hypothetical protein
MRGQRLIPQSNHLQKQTVNRALGVGLTVFIVVYFLATLCFIILE